MILDNFKAFNKRIPNLIDFFLYLNLNIVVILFYFCQKTVECQICPFNNERYFIMLNSFK
jgi:hypothetical protein